MAEIREPPRTLAEFENLSWTEKHQVKQKFPDVYWCFIGRIKEKEKNESR